MMNLLPNLRSRLAAHAIRTFVATLILAAVVAVPQASAQTGDSTRLADEIVAVVNNEVITRSELQDRMQRADRTMRGQGIDVPSGPEFERQVLESMILERAQLQRARELGIRVDDAGVDRAVASIAERNNLSLPAFRQQLEAEGLSLGRFREDVREELMMQRLRELEVENKIQVSESEIAHYLAEDARVAQAEQEFNVSHILIRIPEHAGADQIAERRARAEGVLRQLWEGGDFARLAATYSHAQDALTGGDLGWRTRERLPQLYVEVLEKMSAGQVSPILRSANGFHILKLNDKRRAQSAESLANASVQQTHARHILIRVNQIVSASEARRTLLDLKQRLENGAATFEELARTYSNDLSASKGGDLGWIYPGDTVPQFERAMNALEPGEVSDPVETPFGYHLIQVLDRKQDTVSDERKRHFVRQVLRARKAEEAAEDWLRQLRDSTYVEYRLDDARG